MPSISLRARRVPASPIRKLVPYAEEAKKRGLHVYHLNIGQPDLETPKEWFEAIQKELPSVLSYTHSSGTFELRRSIQAYYQRLGHELTLAQINVTVGASEALLFVLAACLDEGDEFIVPEPFYANYNSIGLSFGTRLVPITTALEQSFALPSLETFEAAITDRTKAIVICNPANPTGTLYPQETMLRIGEIAKKRNLFLISDEVYREFIYDDIPHFSGLDLEGLEEHSVVIDSVSKRFSACGARIGCVISRNNTLMEAILKMAQARLSSPQIEQIGAAAAFALPETYYLKVKEIYRARRDFLFKRLNEIEGVISPKSTGAFYAIARLPVDDAEHFCKWMLESFNYEGATVMMAPAGGFYVTAGLGKNEVRIAYVLDQTDLASAMRCLEEGLSAYRKEFQTNHPLEESYSK